MGHAWLWTRRGDERRGGRRAGAVGRAPRDRRGSQSRLGVLRLAALLAVLGLLALVAAPAAAQTTGGASGATGAGGPSGATSANGIEVVESVAQSAFGTETRELRFLLRARSESPTDGIKAVTLLYQVDGSPVENTAQPNFQPGASVSAVYIWRVAGVLMPGSNVSYRWQIETDGGRRLTTPAQTVSFADARFTWRDSQADQVVIYWHSPDAQTGTALADEARQAQAKLRTDFGLTLDTPVRVYAYTRQQDYLSAVAGGARQVEGSMTVGTDRIFLLAPGGTTGMTNATKALRQEIAAAALAQKTDNPYGPPPRWLSEGFELLMAGEAISEQNYKALGQLAQNNRLLPLRTLNGNFPTSDRDRSLAYVQSLSVVQWMYGTYGQDKVKALFAAIKEGNTPEDAVRKGLGVTFEQFETRWKNAVKNGSAARSASQGAQGRPAGGTAGSPAPVGDGGLVDQYFGPTIAYWRGVLGPSAPVVVIGVSAFIVLGLVAVVAGTIISTVRSARKQYEE
jgi:hypothetical protein